MGKIRAFRPASGDPARTLDEGYMVVAQSNQTGAIYRATTDAEGNFELDIPDSERGNTFVVTILGPDGRAVGPVMYATAGENGLTGLTLEGQASLGTINLPEDPNTAPILPGGDTDVGGLVDPNLSTRLNENGVPAGLGSHGKGQEALGDPAGPVQAVDGDRDGLIDILDADDDGDGIVDDFDGSGDTGGVPPWLHLNFFMNLKIQSERASIYYEGTPEEIAAALATDTIISFEVFTDAGVAPRGVTGGRILSTPAPSYLPNTEVFVDMGDHIEWVPWSDSNYAFNLYPNGRWGIAVRANGLMDAGDTFTADIAFDDGSVAQYSRMLNFVFKNIPKLVKYGTPTSLSDFSVKDEAVDGSPSKPIPFDGTQDLVLVFHPPPDETGAYLTWPDYSFQIFYHAADGRQLNAEIDQAATWPTRPPAFQGTMYWVNNEDLTLAPDNTYTFTLPKEVFPTVVRTTSGQDVTVDSYKIDVTAECPTGNAAIMLCFKKER